MDNFDKALKESLEQHELPMDSSAWANMEQALDKAMPVSGGATGGGSNWGLYAAGSAIVIASAIAVYSLWPNNNQETVHVSPITKEVSKQDPQPQKIELPVTKIDEVGNTNPEKSSIASATENVTNTYGIAEQSTNDAKDTLTKSNVKGANTETNNEKGTENVNSNDEVKPSNRNQLLVNFTPSTLKACDGETVSFFSNSPETNVTYKWNFGDGNISTEDNPNYTFSGPGSYEVTLTGIRKGTDISSSQTITIEILESPNATITATPAAFHENMIKYETVVSQDQSVEWRFSDGTIIRSAQTDHLYRRAGMNTVRLIVKNENGCVERFGRSESINKNLEIYAASAFTPNGNNTNETYFLKSLALLNIPFTFIILDSNNQTVFQTERADYGWNGKMMNTGTDLSEGAYFWHLTLDGKYLNSNTFTGKFNLNRR